MEEKRKNKPIECPKCHFQLLAREDNYIICLSSTCDWKIESKRIKDNNIPKISELKENYG